MSTYKSVDIPCAHESHHIPTEVRVSDYHPLTRRQVELLLTHAQQTGKWEIRNSIQIRLCQAIPGYACPRTFDDRIASKERKVSELYLGHRYKPVTNRIVTEIYNAINAS